MGAEKCGAAVTRSDLPLEKTAGSGGWMCVDQRRGSSVVRTL